MGYFLEKTWLWFLLAIVLAVLITWLIFWWRSRGATGTADSDLELGRLRAERDDAQQKLAALQAEHDGCPQVVTVAQGEPETLPDLPDLPAVATETTPVAEAAPVPETPSVPETAPVAEAMTEPETAPVPVAVAEPVTAVESAPVAEPELVSEPEPAPVPEPVVETVPVAVVTPAADPVTVPETTAEPVLAAPAAQTSIATQEAPDLTAGAAVLGRKVALDRLEEIEGIGPKIAGLLHDASISTWRELSVTPVARLVEILRAAGPRYQFHDPGTWPRQAELLANGQWAEFKEWATQLRGGRVTP